MSLKKILLIEDEKNLAFTLELNLKAEGFEVFRGESGHDALRLYETHKPFSAIILDIMIPEMDGFEVAKYIRKVDNTTGILMLTARAGEEDRLHGLSLGVDDYLTKPFHLDELILRVKRMSERAKLYQNNHKKSQAYQITKSGPFVLDRENLLLKSPHRNHELTILEADILQEFLSNPDKTLSRKYLLKKVWGVCENMETRTVDNFILRIRKILETNPTKPRFLLSIRGKGYRFTLSKQETSTHSKAGNHVNSI